MLPQSKTYKLCSLVLQIYPWIDLKAGQPCCSRMQLYIYIPIWIYLNRCYDMGRSIYIPVWMDLKYYISFFVQFSIEIYIPIWIDLKGNYNRFVQWNSFIYISVYWNVNYRRTKCYHNPEPLNLSAECSCYLSKPNNAKITDSLQTK